VLADLGLPARRFEAALERGRTAEVIDPTVNGVRVTTLPTASTRAERAPDMRESALFLDLADQVLERFRPDVLLTYGGYPASLELMRRARRRGIAVVFHLHNLGDTDRRAFADASTVVFPSEYYRRHHARLIGRDGPVIPDPIPYEFRCLPSGRRSRYTDVRNARLRLQRLAGPRNLQILLYHQDTITLCLAKPLTTPSFRDRPDLSSVGSHALPALAGDETPIGYVALPDPGWKTLNTRNGSTPWGFGADGVAMHPGAL
jgi:hypothetical protein